MELNLKRIISTEKGTNGFLELVVDNKPDVEICKTIELPWHDNDYGKSCIPSGGYELALRHSLHFGDHLLVMNVPNRTLILIHPANDALSDLRGCIAPVTSFNGVGNGNASRAALAKLMLLAKPVLEAGRKLFINVYDVK